MFLCCAETREFLLPGFPCADLIVDFAVTPYGQYAGEWLPYVVAGVGVVAGLLLGLLLCLLWQCCWRLATRGCQLSRAYPNLLKPKDKVSN